jgi:hypothetical protein
MKLIQPPESIDALPKRRCLKGLEPCRLERGHILKPRVIGKVELAAHHTRLGSNQERVEMQFIDLQAQRRRIEPEINAAVQRVIESGRYVLGPEVGELEK